MCCCSRVGGEGTEGGGEGVIENLWDGAGGGVRGGYGEGREGMGHGARGVGGWRQGEHESVRVCVGRSRQVRPTCSPA